MPLQKLQFRPGVNREGTSLANEGGWFESDKVRFRSGFPEKIGGWVKDAGSQNSTGTDLLPPTGSFWGTCRSLWNWLTLAGRNLLGLGTNLKFYIQDSLNGYFYDVTPIRYTVTVASNAFTTTYPTATTTVTCNVAGHGAQVGDFLTISGVASAVNGIPAADLNKEFRVVAVPNSNQFTITVASGATSAGTTGAATFAFQITTGSDIYTVASGWGAGGWGGKTTGFPNTGWGESAATGFSVNIRLWSQANFGENLIFNAAGGPLFFWAVSTTTTTYNRAQIIVAGGSITQKDYATGSGTISIPIDSTCPSVVNFVLVSDASRFTIAFGCNDPTGVYASANLDPMQIRWSDQESYSTWTPTLTNQAGGYRLSHGSEIVAALQTRQEILVWTDTSLYSMQFLGAPLVWSFQIMGDNLSLLGPNTPVTVNNITYWMGTDKFYMYSGRVETLPCSLRQFIYQDINLDQGFQAFGGSNEGYNEIWWFYCSANSDTVDKYVIYNHLERTWAYGTMQRTSWLDSPLRGTPMATGYDGQLIYHEIGNDDGTTSPASPIYSYVRSSDFDIGDGHNFGMVWRMIPDVTFDGSNVNQPTVNFTVLPRTNPGANYGTSDNPEVVSAQNYSAVRTYNVQQFTEYAYVRIRGRQMAFQLSSSNLGVAWQLGTPRLDVRPDGRR
jgi:hypothetical protein